MTPFDWSEDWLRAPIDNADSFDLSECVMPKWLWLPDSEGVKRPPDEVDIAEKVLVFEAVCETDLDFAVKDDGGGDFGLRNCRVLRKFSPGFRPRF